MVVHDYITPLQREIINGFGGGKIIDKPEWFWVPGLVALELSEIAERGIESACPDAYMYYDQTWDFFAAHRKAIIATLAEQAEEGMYGAGVTTALGAVARFSCFDNFNGNSKEEMVEIAAQMFYLPIEEAVEVDGALYVAQMMIWGLIEDTANAIDWYSAIQGKAEAEAVTA